jgi:pimeloyl-ACP methyl ester carboxylesterase
VFRFRRTRAVAVGLCAALGGCTRAPRTRPPAAWTDSSPHRVSFVTVAPGVRLEVLDWGGHGPALVFLSGLDDVAHGFDAFAPQFTDRFHVLAITRRGYGASSHPTTGYDLATRVADLATALDSLHLAPVTLVGHSIAGDELTAFAAKYPARVSKLVYLDAAYDHSHLAGVWSGMPREPLMTAADSASPAAVQAYLLRTFGMRIPQAQIRATMVFGASGKLLRNVTPDSLDQEILRGTGRPDYAVVRAPALAFYAPCDSTRLGYWGQVSDAARAAARPVLAKLVRWCARQRDGFRRGVRHGRVVVLSGAVHYVFYSDAREVAADMRAFLGAGGDAQGPVSGDVDVRAPRADDNGSPHPRGLP